MLMNMESFHQIGVGLSSPDGGSAEESQMSSNLHAQTTVEAIATGTEAAHMR